jgi:hypothetical protein
MTEIIQSLNQLSWPGAFALVAIVIVAGWVLTLAIAKLL